MRYYELTLSAPNGAPLALTSSGFAAGSGGATFSSRVPNPNGSGTVNNPGALDLDFDMPVAPFATPQGLQSIRVWGVGLAQISQSANLNPDPVSGALGAGIVLSAGMAAGLPLATSAAKYAGTIVQGTVFQAYGNWQGANMTLEFVVAPTSLAPTHGIGFSWDAGQPIGAAVRAALTKAFPGYSVKLDLATQVSQSMMSVAAPAWYPTLDDFADMIGQTSRGLGPAQGAPVGYPGVSIALVGKTFHVYDTVGTSVALQFQDLIGQPTWVEPNTVSFKTAIRSDIQLGSLVTFPTGVASPYALTSATAAVPGAPARASSAFKGTFQVNEVHHVGSFRNPDPDAWVTVFTAAAAVGA